MKPIFLSAELKSKIESHGESTYPHECCGILFGKIEDGRKFVHEIRSLENAHEESPGNRYLIPPSEVLKGEKHARENGLEVIGFYHSHPDVAARPSEFDQNHAWPWYSYIIVSVVDGNAKEIFSWELREDRSKFDQEELLINTELGTAGRGGH